MFHKLLKIFQPTQHISTDANAPVPVTGLYRPYEKPYVNFLYNLLFCDDVALFRNQTATSADGLWPTLVAEHPDLVAIRKIADDEGNEGRVRALAYHRLRMSGERVPSKILLGIIVEVPLRQGLDVLAAFSDGGVRYLNQSGKAAIFEGDANPVAALAKELVAVSRPVVTQIGPWDKQRLPPPKVGGARLTFLVSDGLYFGEGPFGTLQLDQMAGPILSKATQLLQAAVNLSTK